MKVRAYMRVAKNSPHGRTAFKIDASPSPNPRPLESGSVYERKQLHTLHFALSLDIPDELLSPAKWPVIEVALEPDGATRVPIEVTPTEA